MAAGEAARANLGKQGLIPLKPAGALAALGEITSNGSVQATVINANWQRAAKLLGSMRPPILDHVLPKAVAAHAGDNALLRHLQQVPAGQRGDFLTEHLQRELQQILGLAQPPVPESRFLELGMDSLMAVELRNRLLAQFGDGFTISSTVVFDYPTIRALAEYLAAQTPEPVAGAVLKDAPVSAPMPTFTALRDNVAGLVERMKPFQDLGIHLQFNGQSNATDADHIEAAVLRQEAETMSREILNDCVLPDTIRPSGVPALPIARRHVLLTGATGYIGGFVLRELLRQRTKVTAVVRCIDMAVGLSKVVAYLRAIGPFDLDSLGYLKIVSGDLEQPRLGLPAEVYAALTGSADTVIHCAASVGLSSSYGELRQSNVLGTRQVLEFACSGAPKVLHYVSGDAVFLAEPYRGKSCVRETEFPETPLGNVLGYGQSKWASESLVREARSRGVQTVVYRPRTVLGSSEDQYWSPKNLATQFASHALATGTISEGERLFEGVPVDIIGKFINACSQDSSTIGQTFHLVNPRPTSVENWIATLKRQQIHMRQLTSQEWDRSFIAQSDADTQHALSELRGTGVKRTILECLHSVPVLDSQNFQRQLAAYGISCPDFESMMTRGWLNSLRLEKGITSTHAG
jgi:thioester reductase-like protein